MGRVVDAVKNAREFLFTSFFGRELVGRHVVASMACGTALHTLVGLWGGTAVSRFGSKLGRG